MAEPRVVIESAQTIVPVERSAGETSMGNERRYRAETGRQMREIDERLQEATLLIERLTERVSELEALVLP